MAVASRTAARDEILAFFRTAWTANGESSSVPVLWDDVKGEIPANTAWARVTVQHASGEQATLSDHVGNRKFRREGLVTIQVFTQFGQGLRKADVLGKIAADAFEGKATQNQIWFRDVTVNEIGQSGDWFQTNVLVSFIYDEIK